MRKSFDDGDHEATAPRAVPMPGFETLAPREAASKGPSLLERALSLEMLAVVVLVLLTYVLMNL
jgi:hypothetical protein